MLLYIAVKEGSVDREQKLTAVLADGTRYRIYRSIVERPGVEVTVTDTAERFALHHNVARMHLSKLEQAGLLSTSLRKGTGGGRPAKLYRQADKVAAFAMPPRRYDFLADLALTVLAETVDEQTIAEICHRAGVEAGRTFVATHPERRPADRTALAEIVLEITEGAGLLPEVSWDGNELALEVRNCVFKEVSTTHPDFVCNMHQPFMEGAIEVIARESGVPHLQASTSISHGDDRCRLRIVFAES
jgi:predicted ArsR family transcriptional regulator